MNFIKLDDDIVINVDNLCFIDLNDNAISFYFNCDRKYTMIYKDQSEAKENFNKLFGLVNNESI